MVETWKWVGGLAKAYWTTVALVGIDLAPKLKTAREIHPSTWGRSTNPLYGSKIIEVILTHLLRAYNRGTNVWLGLLLERFFLYFLIAWKGQKKRLVVLSNLIKPPLKNVNTRIFMSLLWSSFDCAQFLWSKKKKNHYYTIINCSWFVLEASVVNDWFLL